METRHCRLVRSQRHYLRPILILMGARLPRCLDKSSALILPTDVNAETAYFTTVVEFFVLYHVGCRLRLAPGSSQVKEKRVCVYQHTPACIARRASFQTLDE